MYCPDATRVIDSIRPQGLYMVGIDDSWPHPERIQTTTMFFFAGIMYI
jgi:hypothetical protein